MPAIARLSHFRTFPGLLSLIALAFALLNLRRMKTLFKMVFVLAVLGLLLLMGLNNRAPVDFNLPPVLKETFHQPAALMYFAFFGVGVLTGAVITAGTSKRRSLPPIPGGQLK